MFESSLAILKPLIHLKYLAIYAPDLHLHPELHLPHLETLIVKCFNHHTSLPAFFWKMEKLRHVKVIGGRFHLENKESSKLENLRILRGVEIPFDQVDRVDVLLGRCPNLQELDIRLKGNEYYAEPFCLNLESLTQLQSLRLSYECPLVLSGLHLPLNLKKLVLSRVPIENLISSIAGLPSLEYLKLGSRASFQSEEWCLGDITFHKLKFLKLIWLGISTWDASEESFPLLETLVISGCDLEEIPLSFADIPTLKQITLIGFRKESLEASAVQIKEEVENIEGCNHLSLISIDRRGNLKQL